MLAGRILRFWDRPFIRSVIVVASGTAVAQVISMAFAPIITRLYGPETYGVMGVFMALAVIASTIAATAYPIAIVLPKSDVEALNLVRLSVAVGGITSSLVALVLFVYGAELASFLSIGGIGSLLYFIPVYMFATVASAVAEQWLVRMRAFGLIARVAMWQATLLGAVKSTVGLYHPTAGVLIGSNVLGGFLSAVLVIIGWRHSRSNGGINAPVAVSLKTMRKVARHYRDFPMFRAPQNLLNAIVHSLPALMLAAFFGASSAGLYTLAFSALALPAGLVGESVARVFYPRISSAIRHGENVRRLILTATAGLAVSGALPFAVLIAIGPALFSFVFGAEWERAGVYAQWLSVWLFFQYINRPAVAAIPALGIQRGLLVYEVFSSSAKAVALYLGYVVIGSDLAAIAMFSIFGSVAYAWLILWVLKVSGEGNRRSA